MIGSIRGKIIFKTEKFLIVETSGIGYKISVSPDALFKTKDLEKEIFLFIHTHVREDALDLYGFLDKGELEFFEMLINVSGIGQKERFLSWELLQLKHLKKQLVSEIQAILQRFLASAERQQKKL